MKMLRYCFTSSLPTSNFHNIVESIYDYSTVGESSTSYGAGLNADEACVEGKDLLRANTKLSKQPNFTIPILIPDWKVLSVNNGPFITEEHITSPLGTIYNIATNASWLATRLQDSALRLYAKLKNPPELVKQNFWNSFMQLGDYHEIPNIDFIRLDNFKSSTKFAVPNQTKYGYVTIDGKRVGLSTFSTPPMSLEFGGNLANDGKIRLGVTRQDVIVNCSVAVPGFHTENYPGSSWASKWRKNPKNPHEFGYCFLDFTIQEHVGADVIYADQENDFGDEDLGLFGSVGSSLDGSVESVESGASEVQQYPEDDVARSAPIYDQDSDLEDFEQGPVISVGNGYTDVMLTLDTDAVLEKQDFENLTENERKYLPLSYILTPSQQWNIILRAIVSNYTDIFNLKRVSDYTLATVADAVVLALENGNQVPASAVELVNYAHARDV